MPDIFDNLKTESSIGPALQAAFANFDTSDVATGYLDLHDAREGPRDPM